MKAVSVMLLALSSLSSVAQVVFPDNGVWERSYHSIAWGHGGEVLWNYTIYSTYFVNGDTTVGDSSYLKIYNGLQPAGYVKVNENKIFFGPATDLLHPMFDFGLNQGDTFTFYAPSYPYGILQSTVQSVDSVLIKGVLRKRIQFNDFTGYGAGPLWIEGIGDVNFGGIEPDYSYVSWYANTTTLNCFSQNGENIYGACTNGIAEKVLPAVLYPNPTSGLSTLDLTMLGKPVTVRLLDPGGRELLRGEYQDDKLSLDFSPMARGIYFIVLQNQQQLIVQKVVRK
jgi:hypothetical protein